MKKIKHKTKESTEVAVHVVSTSATGRRNIFIFGGLLLLVLLSAAWLLAHNVTTPKNSTDSVAKQDIGIVTKNDISSLEKSTANSASPDEYAALGGAYIDNNQADKAIAAYKKSLELAPQNNVQAVSGLMYAYAKSGNTQEAIVYVNQLIELAKKGTNGLTQADTQKYQVQLKRLQQGLDI